MCRTCRDCGTAFETKKVKKGYIDQCDECSQDNVRRYIGRPVRIPDGLKFQRDLDIVRDQREIETAKTLLIKDGTYAINV